MRSMRLKTSRLRPQRALIKSFPNVDRGELILQANTEMVTDSYVLIERVSSRRRAWSFALTHEIRLLGKESSLVLVDRSGTSST